MLDPKIAQRISKSADWRFVEDHISEAIDSLDRSSDIDTSDDRACAIEVAARKHAAKILRKILAPFADVQQPVDQETLREDTRRRAGLV